MLYAAPYTLILDLELKVELGNMNLILTNNS